MSRSPQPLVPAEIWPRVQELFLELVERTPREQDEALLEEMADVRYWVRELLTAEPLEILPINFRRELSTLRVGTVVGSRYLLEHCLGMGGFGDVYQALDQVTNQAVAVKLVPKSSDDETEPYEWAILRVIDIPGVVSLLDVCHDQDHSVLVMPLLDGEAFPGKKGELSSEQLEERTVSLLECLERLHAAGFVHGDVKPSNIMVDDGGRPSILDLGVAQRWRRPAYLGLDRIALSPEYAAPEVLGGDRATPRSDLYSLGLILYEAVSGELPDCKMSGGSFTRAPFAPIRKLCPDLSGRLSALIDSLLGFAARPGSATDALVVLGHGTLEDRVRQHVGRLGCNSEVNDLVHALRIQKPVSLVGERQSGKTALLEEVERLLHDAGERVVRLPGNVDGILREYCPPEEITALGSWENLRGLVIERLEGERDSGVFLLFDDFDVLDDDELVHAVERLHARGGVLLARTASSDSPSPALAPLQQSDLESVFEGPSAILHLPEDAARQLHLRTRGWRGRVIRELAAWVRVGIAALGETGQVSVTRGNLHRLTNAFNGPLRTPSLQNQAFGAEEKRLLAVAQIAPDGVTREVLVRALPDLALHLESHLAGLLEKGALEELDRRFFATARVSLADVFSEREQELLHGVIADSLSESDPRRVRFRVFSGEAEEIAGEALPVGRSALQQGQPGVAFSALLEGVRNLPGGEHPARVALLSELTEATLTLQSRPAIQRALHELALAPESQSGLADLMQILTLAVRLQAHEPGRIREVLREWRPLTEARWQRWYAALLAHASRLTGEVRFHEEACELLTRLSTRGDTDAARELSVILGHQHYVEGSFESAARFRERVVALAPDPARKCAGLLSLAIAHKELGLWELAESSLKEARALAVELRFSIQEARCEWLQGSLAYRRGKPEAVEEEVFVAARALGLLHIAAQIHLTEAARLWREEELEGAREHSARAIELWQSAPNSPGRLVARSLAVAAGEPVSRADVETLLEEGSGHAVPGAAVQVAGLLSSVFPGIVTESESLKRSLERSIARYAPRARPLRREVLSITEAERMIFRKKM